MTRNAKKRRMYMFYKILIKMVYELCLITKPHSLFGFHPELADLQLQRHQSQ